MQNKDNTLKIYKASAGSGKTFTLAVEYIKLLVTTDSPTEYTHTLAVTFTNKATAEMKDRILEQLYGIWQHDPNSEKYMLVLKEKLAEEGITIPDETIRRRAGESLRAILHNYDMFRVETIDSFFQSVLNSLAHELGLTAGLQVDLNDKEVVGRAVDRIIESIGDDQKLKNWILSYIQERIENDEAWNVTDEIKAFAQCIFQEKFMNREEKYRACLNDETAIKDFRQKMMGIIKNTLPPIQEKATLLDKSIQQNGLGGYEQLTRKGSYLRGFLDKAKAGTIEYPSKSVRDYADNYESLLNAANRKNEGLMKEARRISELLEALIRNIDKELPQHNAARMAIKYLNPLRLLGSIEQVVSDINNEKGRFTLAQTPALLHDMIDEQDSPFVFEKSGIQFHNIMIDEFQDTSHLQWENFQALLLENQANGGSNLIVGDVKQSIYRFRNGDWEILHQLENTAHKFNPHVEHLSYNRRSLRRIIDFNNRFFAAAPRLLDTLAPDNEGVHLTDIYKDGEQKIPESREDTGYVRIHLCTPKQEDPVQITLLDMLEQVRTLIQSGLSPSHIAILVRKNSQATQVLDFFTREAPEIDIVSDEAFLLESSFAVRMIINALRWLCDRKHKNSIALRELVTQYQIKVKQQDTMPDYLSYEEMEAMLPQEIVNQKERIATMPLYQCCEELYRGLGLENIPGQDAYIMGLFDHIQDFLRDHTGSTYAFLQVWDEKYHADSIPSGQTKGIRILTIHKSKGLEFHTVMLPFCDTDIESDMVGKNKVHWIMPDDENRREVYGSLGPLPLNINKSMSESVFRDFYEEEHLQRRVDALNTMYVAFTRAGSNLFIWGRLLKSTKPLSNEGELIYKAIPALCEATDDGPYIYTEGMPVTEAKKEEEAYTRVHPHYTDKSVPMKSFAPQLMNFRQSGTASRFMDSLDEGEHGKEERIEGCISIGNLIHDILSRIQYRSDAQRVLSESYAQGNIADEDTMNIVQHALARGWQDETISEWFDTHWRVYNECTIVEPGYNGGTPTIHRADRVIMDNERVVVIDYKTGLRSKEHSLQVKRYMALVQKMYPHHRIEGYLWYLGNRFEVEKVEI